MLGQVKAVIPICRPTAFSGNRQRPQAKADGHARLHSIDCGIRFVACC